jgi:guanine nucleotide-binding protein subunit alpha
MMAPPPNETPAERTTREGREAEARRVSDKIDEGIKNDKLTLKKQKNVVKVLLLGQSESGKSPSIGSPYAFSSRQGKSTTLKSSYATITLPSHHPDSPSFQISG